MLCDIAFKFIVNCLKKNYKIKIANVPIPISHNVLGVYLVY